MTEPTDDYETNVNTTEAIVISYFLSYFFRWIRWTWTWLITSFAWTLKVELSMQHFSPIIIRIFALSFVQFRIITFKSILKRCFVWFIYSVIWNWLMVDITICQNLITHTIGSFECQTVQKIIRFSFNDTVIWTSNLHWILLGVWRTFYFIARARCTFCKHSGRLSFYGSRHKSIRTVNSIRKKKEKSQSNQH